MKNLDYKIIEVKGKFGRTDVDEHAEATIKFKNSIIANIECSFLKKLLSYLYHSEDHVKQIPQYNQS